MFAFFIHPRDISDEIDYHDVERIKRIYGILPFGWWIPIGWLTKLIRTLPNKRIGNKILSLLPPLVTGKLYSSERTVGWIVTIPMTAGQMLSMFNGSAKQKAALEQKMVQAVKLSQKMGARIVGLGAMTSTVTNSGRGLSKKVEGVGITNGNAFTAVATVKGFREVAKQTGINLDCAEIAIVGATGSVGKASTILLADSLKKGRMLLISLSPGKLQQLKKTIEERNPNINVALSCDISAIRKCDIVLVATSHPDTLIRKEHLKKGTVIYDDTQPRNVSREIANDPNFLVVDGSIMRVPSVQNTMNIGLPTSQDMYACEAETWLLSQHKRFGDFALGRDVFAQANEVLLMAENYANRIVLAPFRSFGRELTKSDFERIKQMRSNL